MAVSSRIEIIQRLAKDHLRLPPPSLPPGASVRDAVLLLSEARCPAIFITDARGQPIGVFTAHDVVARVTWRTDPEDKIETVMSRNVVSIGTDDKLIRAVAVMRERRLSRLAVVDASGCLAGSLELSDAALALAGPVRQLMAAMPASDDLDECRRSKAAQLDLAAALLADNVGAPEVQQILSEFNAELHRRVLARALGEMETDGWGRPPVAYALIVMGSCGREESGLDPDQDNGLIIADYPDADHNRIDGFFLELARRLVTGLNGVGLGFCKGNVMAVNPVWRKRLSEWRLQFETWRRVRVPAHLLHSDVLFDFRMVAGDEALAAELRRFITAKAAASPNFVRALLEIEHDHKVALGWFGQLSKEVDDDGRPAVINMKLRGLLPLVEAARLLALRAGITATSTLGRLDTLRERGVVNAADHADLVAAYHHIGRILLRNQVNDRKAGRPATDYVAEASLSKTERDQLVDSFRRIGGFRDVLSERIASGPMPMGALG